MNLAMLNNLTTEELIRYADPNNPEHAHIIRERMADTINQGACPSCNEAIADLFDEGPRVQNLGAGPIQAAPVIAIN